MRILIVTPAPPKSRSGNRVTALRWSRLLRELGHLVSISQEFQSQRCELMIALHARRSAASIAAFRARHPHRPLVLALTGTDLYGDIHRDQEAQRSLHLADRFVVLQPLGVRELPEDLQPKSRTIYQAVVPPAGSFEPRTDCFEVTVVGHLREVKDPFRTAAASRLLPPSSRISITHLGAALSPEMANLAIREQAQNPRYHWLGDVPRWKSIRAIARSRLLVLSSEMEGGANVVSEALACGTPVLSTRIAGSVGLLGEKYPGYFPYGDTGKLADLLKRVEIDKTFYGGLAACCRERAPITDPAHERSSWAELLGEIT